MKTYRKVGQTKFVKDGMKGLLTIRDNGSMAVSVDHKELFSGLQYFKSNSYYCIDNPTTRDRKTIMDRLFDYSDENHAN